MKYNISIRFDVRDNVWVWEINYTTKENTIRHIGHGWGILLSETLAQVSHAYEQDIQGRLMGKIDPYFIQHCLENFSS